MAGALGGLNIWIGLDSVAFQKGLDKAEYQTQKFVKSTDKAFKNVEKSLKNLEKASGWATKGFLGGKAVGLGKSVIQHADAYTEIGNRMKLVTSNSVESARAMQTVFDVSLRTNQSVDGTAQVYQRFAQNAQQLGISQAQVASLTETVSKAVAISGASAASAQAALMQFGQSLASGVFRGQEFNSVMEQTPGLAQAIARGLGVTIGELRQMANDGKLTMDVLIPALEKAKASVDQQFSTRVLTVSAAFENLKTATTQWIGELNTGTLSTSTLAKGINIVANNFDQATKAAAGFAAIAGYIALRSKISTLADNQNQKMLAQQQVVLEQQKATALAQTTQANYSKVRSEYDLAKAEISSMQTTRQQIVVEREKLAVQIQGAASYSERKLLSAELALLTQKETTLTQLQSAAEQKMIATKKGLKIAYAENAVAQSAYSAGMIKAGTATKLFQALSVGVRNELKMLKVAFLTNPIGIMLTGVTALAGLYMLLGDSTDEAKRAQLEYAEALDVSESALKSMTAAQVEANVTLLSAAIAAQSAALEKLTQQYERAKQAAKESSITTYDSFGGPSYTYNKSDKEMVTARQEEARLLLAVKEAQDKVAASQEKLAQLAGIQADKIKDELNAALKDSGVILQQLDPDMQKFANELLDVNSHVLTLNPNLKALMGTTLQLASAAVQAALGLEQMNQAKNQVYSDNAQQEIERLQRQAKIAGAKTDKERIKYQVEDYRAGLEKRAEKDGLSQYDIDGMAAAYEKMLATRQGNKPTKSGKKEKSLEDWKTDWDSFHDEIQRSNASAMKTIELNELRLSQKIDEFRKNGVISEAEAAAARLQIEQRYIQERLELAGQYNQAIAAQQRYKKIMEDVTALEKSGHLTKDQADEVKSEANWQLWKDQADKSDPLNGVTVAMHDFGKATEDVMGNVANITQNALGGMSDALTDFVLTGKADFRGLAQSIIKDITGMIIKMMIFNALKSALGGTSLGAALGFDGGGLVGFDGGGYTGHGNRLTPAGIVHKGEYVLTKEATSRIGREYLDFLNYAGGRGFANGGGVAVPKVPSMNYRAQSASNNENHVEITVNVTESGQNADVQASGKMGAELGRMIKSKVLEVLNEQSRAGGMLRGSI
ncbi:phage tail tape measure protein [Testudinibacter sp. P80/BLE/0925]|uniref:phage tail tape measure protein n=1 Tax=Testudinibacter sp. TW-1 TaxID=3417757 RepID=UPI003D35FEFD